MKLKTECAPWYTHSTNYAHGFRFVVFSVGTASANIIFIFLPWCWDSTMEVTLENKAKYLGWGSAR